MINWISLGVKMSPPSDHLISYPESFGYLLRLVCEPDMTCLNFWVEEVLDKDRKKREFLSFAACPSGHLHTCPTAASEPLCVPCLSGVGRGTPFLQSVIQNQDFLLTWRASRSLPCHMPAQPSVTMIKHLLQLVAYLLGVTKCTVPRLRM